MGGGFPAEDVPLLQGPLPVRVVSRLELLLSGKDCDVAVHVSVLPKLAVCLGPVVSGRTNSVLLKSVTSLLLLSVDSVGDDHAPCLPALWVCLCLVAGGTQTRLRFSGLR